MLQSLKAVWTQRWTKVWGWTKITAGSLVLAVHPLLGEIGQAVSNPDIKAELVKFDVPYIGLGLAVIGFITLASMEHKD